MRRFAPALLLLCLMRPAASEPRAEAVVAAPADRSVTFAVQGVSLRSALARLFQGTGLSYAVAPDVPDPLVTLSVQEVSFGTALQTLTRVADVSYRRENGVYVIGVRPAASEPAGATAAPEVAPRVTLQLKEVPLRQALQQLFERVGFRLAVASDVPNPPITLEVRNEEFATALRQILRLSAVATYRKEGNIYIIGVRPPEAQEPVRTRVTLALKEVPFRRALELLFEGSGQRCAVELGIPDTRVTLDLRNEPIATALQRLTERVGASYRREGDFFIVEKQPTPAPPAQ